MVLPHSCTGCGCCALLSVQAALHPAAKCPAARRHLCNGPWRCTCNAALQDHCHAAGHGCLQVCQHVCLALFTYVGWTVQVEYHGFGLTIPPERLTAPILSAALQSVLQEPHFKVNCTLPLNPMLFVT